MSQDVRNTHNITKLHVLTRLFTEAVAGTTDEKSYTHIIAETKGKVGLITLNRPKALNALCSDLFTEVNEALRSYDSNDNIGAVVITGSKKAFAGKFCKL